MSCSSGRWHLIHHSLRIYNMKISTAQFLYPNNFQKTSIDYKNVLVCGSCFASTLIYFLKWKQPNVRFDHVFINNGAILPEKLPLEEGNYDFQVITLPLRDILTDSVVKLKDYLDQQQHEEIVERAYVNLDTMFVSATAYADKHGIPTMVLGFSVPIVSVSDSIRNQGTEHDLRTMVINLNRRLASLVQKKEHCVLIDYDVISSCIGKRYVSEETFGFYSHGVFSWDEICKHDYSSSYNAPTEGRLENVPPLSEYYGSEIDALIESLWRAFDSAYRIINQIDAVKLVVFDLDDTLWRGQIAEHYPDNANWPTYDGWPLGIWEAIHHLKARGILVAIVSKNEESIVRNRWERGVREPWLQLEDFIITCINWEPKAENIRRIIAQTSLTPKSIVFVDDNPVERESVLKEFPDIRTTGSNPLETKRLLLWAPETNRSFISAESKNREESIKGLITRESDRVALTRHEFLKNLGCTVKIEKITSFASPSLPRCFELLNRTNQFNTTGKRWTSTDIQDYLSDQGSIFSISVSDKYSQYGLVGVILYRNGEFTQFCLSCRVLGLEVEESVLSTIVSLEYKTPNIAFTGKIIPTDTNIVSRDVYTRVSMVPKEFGIYHLEHISKLPPPAPHLSIDIISGGK